MNYNLFIAVALFAIVPMAASAQTDGDDTKAPKPTIADAQKLVQMIISDKAKLKAYCDIGKLEEQIESTEQKLRSCSPSTMGRYSLFRSVVLSANKSRH